MKNSRLFGGALLVVLLAGCSAASSATPASNVKPTQSTNTLAAERNYVISMIQLVIEFVIRRKLQT